MTPFYTDPLVTLYLGDCLEVMPTLEAESIDAVVTDPPYGLGFMGKHWDHGVPAREFWEAMLRVAKPGAYLLAFGGTRTVHRIAVNIEDAGWIIRDQLAWIYASGFPKGRANLKPAHEPIVLARKPGPLRPLAIDECRIGVSDDEPNKRGDRGLGRSAGGFYGDGSSYSQGDTGKVEEYHQHAGRWPSNVLLSDPELFDEPNPEVVGSGAVTTSGLMKAGQPKAGESVDIYGAREGYTLAGDTYADSGGYSRFFRVPQRSDDSDRFIPDWWERSTEETRRQLEEEVDREVPPPEGDGPIPPSNPEQGNTGARYNGTCVRCGAPIAASSLSSDSPVTSESSAPAAASANPSEPSDQDVSAAVSPSDSPETDTAPRPAPTPPDGTTDSTASADARTTKSGTSRRSRSSEREASPTTTFQPPTDASSAERSDESIDTTTTTAGPSMCASCAASVTPESTPPQPRPTSAELLPVERPDSPRYLIIPKSDRAERERGLAGRDERSVGTRDRKDRQWDIPGSHSTPRANHHPTVKPIDLMRHLVRLVTPTAGVVLDPFLGSGTTALAASEEGFRCIGIEGEPDYLEIAKGRLLATPMGLGLDVPAPTRKRSLPTDEKLAELAKTYPGQIFPNQRPDGLTLAREFGEKFPDLDPGDEEPAA